MRISDSILDEIRHRVSLVDFIASYGVAVKRAGSSYKACCPFHREKTPSFHIHEDRRFYHCFGCGEHGDIFTFLQKQSGLSFTDAVLQLAEKCGIKIESGFDPESAKRDKLHALHTHLAAFYQRCLLQTKEAQPARDYLASRDLRPDIIKRFGIGYAPTAKNALLRWAEKHAYDTETLLGAGLIKIGDRSGDIFDRFQGRLIFPICDTQGRTIAFSARVLPHDTHPAKYVNSPETTIFKKSRVLYGLHLARAPITRSPHREAILCEGQIDVIRCHAAGFDTAVASQGTAFTPEHADILKRYADSALIAYDADPAGQKAALRTAQLLLAAGLPVRVLTLPPGEDPDTLLRRSPSAFQSAAASALSPTAFQIRHLQQSEPDPFALDAISRTTRALIETLSDCPSATLRAHLLTEAATLLHLPPAALEEDLEKFRADAQARAAVIDAAKTAAAEPRGNAPHPATVATPPTLPHTEPNAPSAPGHQPSTIPPPLPSVQLPSRIQTALCKLFFNQRLDKHVTLLIRDWLPLSLPLHPFTRRIIQAALDDLAPLEPSRLSALSHDPDPAFRAYAIRLAAAHSPIDHSEELSLLDEARDLLTALWSSEILKSHRDALPPDDPQRLLITRTIKQLQRTTWDIRQELLRPFLSQTTPHAAPPPPPSPATPAAPSSRGVAKPLPHHAPPVMAEDDETDHDPLDVF